MKKKTLIKKNDAVSGVIEALLLVALVAIILAIIQVIYIPEIMIDREIEHMNEVEKQFSNLKATIDIQSITEENAPVISVITLGNKELPYFVSVGSTGFLRIINQSIYNITFIPNNGNFGLESEVDFNRTVFPLSSIKYSAYNYYISNEDYLLEGGMFIIRNSAGENVKIKPDIEIVENNTNYLKLQMRLPVFLPAEGKEESPPGDGPSYIRTSYSSSDSYYSDRMGSDNNISSIKIFTDYVESWNSSLNEILENEINNGYVNVNVVRSSPKDYVEITSLGKNIHFSLYLSYINTQIGPGVIKN